MPTERGLTEAVAVAAALVVIALVAYYRARYRNTTAFSARDGLPIRVPCHGRRVEVLAAEWLPAAGLPVDCRAALQAAYDAASADTAGLVASGPLVGLPAARGVLRGRVRCDAGARPGDAVAGAGLAPEGFEPARDLGRECGQAPPAGAPLSPDVRWAGGTVARAVDAAGLTYSTQSRVSVTRAADTPENATVPDPYGIGVGKMNLARRLEDRFRGAEARRERLHEWAHAESGGGPDLSADVPLGAIIARAYGRPSAAGAPRSAPDCGRLDGSRPPDLEWITDGPYTSDARGPAADVWGAAD